MATLLDEQLGVFVADTSLEGTLSKAGLKDELATIIRTAICSLPLGHQKRPELHCRAACHLFGVCRQNVVIQAT